MSAVRGHKPGMLCWAELFASELDGACGFYGELFGWSFEAVGACRRARRQASAVAGLAELMPAQRAQRLGAHWVCHFAVTDAEEACRRATGAGGRTVAPAFDWAGGRVGLVADPGGAVVGLWQARPRIGAELLGEPGALTWAELQAPDVDGAIAFHRALFGWTPQRIAVGQARYTVFNVGDVGTAGLKASEAGPARWMPCFAVEDCDASTSRACALGGEVESGPADVAHVGRFATVIDAQGARFQVMHPARRA